MFVHCVYANLSFDHSLMRSHTEQNLSKFHNWGIWLLMELKACNIHTLLTGVYWGNKPPYTPVKCKELGTLPPLCVCISLHCQLDTKAFFHVLSNFPLERFLPNLTLLHSMPPLWSRVAGCLLTARAWINCSLPLIRSWATLTFLSFNWTRNRKACTVSEISSLRVQMSNKPRNYVLELLYLRYYYHVLH